MSLNISGNPIGFTSLLKDGYKHFEEAIYKNIGACLELTRLTKTSFGPYSMNKLVVNNIGKLFVTSDAATIMNELEVVHPAGKLLVMNSQQQESEYGDGTNIVLILAGELLKQAEDLLSMGVCVSNIIEGYEVAFKEAMTLLEKSVIKTITNFTFESLIGPVKCTIGTKQHGQEDFIGDLICKAAMHVMPQNPKKFNIDSVRVLKLCGGSYSDSQVISGMVLERLADSTIKSMKNAKIAAYSGSLDIGRTETKGVVLLHGADELMKFSKGEEDILEAQFKKVAESGVQVLITNGVIGEVVLHFINRFGLMAFRIPSKYDFQRLCKTVHASAMARFGPPTPEEMGFCDIIESIEIGSSKCTVFKQTNEQTKISTIILRGGAMSYLDDLERAIDDGVNTIKSLTQDGRLLPGAGAIEIELAHKIAEFSEKVTGMAQYGIMKYALALESVPRSLAENLGLNTAAIIAELYCAHSLGSKTMGINVGDEGGIVDTQLKGIVDVYSCKKSALHLATDAALSVLRVDSIIMSKASDSGIKPRAPGQIDPDN